MHFPYRGPKQRRQERVQLYLKGCQVIKALNNRCAASEGPYLLGSRPSTLDAKAYGLLAYITAAPTIAPVLKDELQSSPALQRFLAHVSEVYFAAPAPTLNETADNASWSSAAAGATSGGAHVVSEEEKKAWRVSKWWLGGAGALVVGYALFGGHYFDIGVYAQDDDEDDDGNA
jgi:hypothetical protein